ncbi:MAG: Fic family protein [Kiritimatiellae bacterium]|nr:Fic family protein [Kiritimatiellia bacterium]
MRTKESYKPTYTISAKAINLIAEISALIEGIGLSNIDIQDLHLRKTNLIKTIQGSTAIEGNTLTEEQITAILDGKKVIAPKKEIDEVLGAASAYEQIQKIDPTKVNNILHIHKIMMENLVEESGTFRTKQVGVIDASGNVIHMPPPSSLVPTLIKDLVKWLNRTDEHPLIKSCIFHYEFEFIHPFIDGNGRVGRYLQTSILGKWKKIFYTLPIENIVWQNQNGYYLALRRSSLIGDCFPFIEFMLERIKETILEAKQATTKNVGVNVGVSVGVKLSARDLDLLELLRIDNTLTALRIAETYSISTRQAERILTKLKNNGLIVRVGSDKSGHWKVVKNVASKLKKVH